MLSIKSLILYLVREGGLEPPNREVLDPKSSASTNFATLAFRITELIQNDKVNYFFRHRQLCQTNFKEKNEYYFCLLHLCEF